MKSTALVLIVVALLAWLLVATIRQYVVVLRARKNAAALPIAQQKWIRMAAFSLPFTIFIALAVIGRLLIYLLG